MISKEKWLEIRNGWERMNSLRDLVIEKYKEKVEVRTGSKWNEDNEIESVEFYPKNDTFDYDHFALDIRYGRGGCSYTESDFLDVKYLYDEKAIEEYRKEIEEERRIRTMKAKEQEKVMKKRREDAEIDNLFELVKKHGYVLTITNK